jgi:hypothetical protein
MKQLIDRWHELTLAEQLGNVGSDVDRILSWRKKGNEEYATNAFHRSLELLDLTINDDRWRGPKLKELCRLREVLCDSFFGGENYNTPLEYFSKYFYQFALVVAGRKI